VIEPGVHPPEGPPPGASARIASARIASARIASGEESPRPNGTSLEASPFWHKILLALVSGAVFYVLSTPRELAFLQWMAWVPLCIALQGNRPRRDFFLGWLSGVMLHLVGFYWIVHTISVFSNLPLPVALFVLCVFAAYGALPFGLLGLAVPRLRARYGAWSILVTPAVWVTIEALFPMLFPFHQGDVQFRLLPILQLASITGIAGVSYLVMASNVAIFELWRAARDRTRIPWPPLLVTAAMLLGVYVWGAQRVQRIDAEIAASPRLRIGLIQGNYGVQERRKTSSAQIFERYERLSDEAVRKGATLLIWGEGASPFYPGKQWSKVEAFVRDRRVDLITGGSGSRQVEGQVLHHNSAYGLEHEDAPGSQQRYDKMILLAFGEYLPFSDWFPSLKGKISGIGDFTPGTEPSLFTFQQPGGQVRALLLICYEAILERFVQERAAGAPNLLVNITHDAWFGDTSCPHQFLMLVVPRAVEHGSSMARVANTGISAVIDPTGRIRDQTPVFEQAVIVEDVTLSQFPTPYRQWGRAFVIVCELLTAAAAVHLWRTGGRKFRA